MRKLLGKRIHDTRETVQAYSYCTTCSGTCSICDCDCSAHGAPNYAVANSFGVTANNAVTEGLQGQATSLWNN